MSVSQLYTISVWMKTLDADLVLKMCCCRKFFRKEQTDCAIWCMVWSFSGILVLGGAIIVRPTGLIYPVAMGCIVCTSPFGIRQCICTMLQLLLDDWGIGCIDIVPYLHVLQKNRENFHVDYSDCCTSIQSLKINLQVIFEHTIVYSATSNNEHWNKLRHHSFSTQVTTTHNLLVSVHGWLQIRQAQFHF